jgi:hypothetical protein
MVALEMAELLRKKRGIACPVVLIDSFAHVEAQEDPSLPHYELLERHQPARYTGPVHLLHSTTSPRIDNGWNFLPNLSISEIPFRHEEMFNEGNIPVIAKMVSAAIADFDCLSYNSKDGSFSK